MVLLSITISNIEDVLGRGPLFIQLFPHHQVRIISDNTNNFENGYQKLIHIYKLELELYINITIVLGISSHCF